MIHLLFERTHQVLKVFHSDHAMRYLWKASGAATATSRGPMPQGHYILLEPELFPERDRDNATGWGRVRIRDMQDRDVSLLVKAGLATIGQDGRVNIGGVALTAGRCNAYPRAIEIHGGGSALHERANDPMQDLCRTLGCTRMHNQDIKTLIEYMQQFGDGNTFVFSAMGTPAPCQC